MLFSQLFLFDRWLPGNQMWRENHCWANIWRPKRWHQLRSVGPTSGPCGSDNMGGQTRNVTLRKPPNISLLTLKAPSAAARLTLRAAT